jgi:HSP20 family protein
MVQMRYDWLSNIQGMQREMERLLNYLGNSKPPMVSFARMWAPAVDVYESENSIVVLLELAGVNQDNIDVTVTGSTLVVRGERSETNPASSKTYYQIEIHRGYFERAILLPCAVDPNRTEASYKDGLLEIVLPKLEEERIMRLRVKTPEEA